MIVVLGWQGYPDIGSQHITAVHNQGALSDVADEVLSLPLHSTGYTRSVTRFISSVRTRQCFLISKGIIYRFNRHGDLVCRITDPKMIHVAGYVLDPALKRVVVLGNGWMMSSTTATTETHRPAKLKTTSDVRTSIPFNTQRAASRRHSQTNR